MDKVMRDLAWKCLPKEARAYVREMHKSADQEYKFHKGKRYALEMTFGKSNLESDTEPEDILITPIKRAQHLYEEYKNLITPTTGAVDKAAYGGVLLALQELFGDKCLPDKPSNGAIGTTPPAVKLDVKQTPKFGKGNKVKVASGLYYVGETLEISDVEWDEEEYVYYFADKLKSIPEGRLEPYTEPETKPFRVGDKVKVKGEDKVREIFRILPDGRIMFGDKGNAYSVENLELVESETKEPECVHPDSDNCKWKNICDHTMCYFDPIKSKTKDNTQQNSWDEDFKKMNECFEKIQKTLSSLCDTFGKLEANVNKLNRL